MRHPGKRRWKKRSSDSANQLQPRQARRTEPDDRERRGKSDRRSPDGLASLRGRSLFRGSSRPRRLLEEAGRRHVSRPHSLGDPETGPYDGPKGPWAGPRIPREAIRPVISGSPACAVLVPSQLRMPGGSGARDYALAWASMRECLWCCAPACRPIQERERVLRRARIQAKPAVESVVPATADRGQGGAPNRSSISAAGSIPWALGLLAPPWSATSRPRATSRPTRRHP